MNFSEQKKASTQPHALTKGRKMTDHDTIKFVSIHTLNVSVTVLYGIPQCHIDKHNDTNNLKICPTKNIPFVVI